MDVQMRHDALAGVGCVQAARVQWEGTRCARLRKGQADSSQEVHDPAPAVQLLIDEIPKPEPQPDPMP
eukprot:3910892-Alexandrium_andersonii.AAC.1